MEGAGQWQAEGHPEPTPSPPEPPVVSLNLKSQGLGTPHGTAAQPEGTIRKGCDTFLKGTEEQ